MSRQCSVNFLSDHCAYSVCSPTLSWFIIISALTAPTLGFWLFSISKNLGGFEKEKKEKK